MKNLKNLKSFSDINEVKVPADVHAWLNKFFEFIDTAWQEDNEISIVEMLGAYRKQMVSAPEHAFDYLHKWNEKNKATLDKVLGITTSEKFASEYDALLKAE